MMAIMIVYVSLFLLYSFYQLATVIRFRKNQRHFSAKLLTEKLYSTLLIATAIIYIGIVTDQLIEVFSDIHMYSYPDSRIPFVLSVLPLIIITYNIFLCEGLFAYSDKYLIGCNLKIPLSSIKITNISVNRFKKVKAKIVVCEEFAKKNKEIVMRASLTNFNMFKQYLEEEMSL